MFATNPALEQSLVDPQTLSYGLKLLVEAYRKSEFKRQYPRDSLHMCREQNDIVSAVVAEGFLMLDADSVVEQDVLMSGTKIFAELLAMKTPRLAEVLERLKQATVWQAQATAGTCYLRRAPPLSPGTP